MQTPRCNRAQWRQVDLQLSRNLVESCQKRSCATEAQLTQRSGRNSFGRLLLALCEPAGHCCARAIRSPALGNRRCIQRSPLTHGLELAAAAAAACAATARTLFHHRTGLLPASVVPLAMNTARAGYDPLRAGLTRCMPPLLRTLLQGSSYERCAAHNHHWPAAR